MDSQHLQALKDYLDKKLEPLFEFDRSVLAKLSDVEKELTALSVQNCALTAEVNGLHCALEAQSRTASVEHVVDFELLILQVIESTHKLADELRRFQVNKEKFDKADSEPKNDDNSGPKDDDDKDGPSAGGDNSPAGNKKQDEADKGGEDKKESPGDKDDQKQEHRRDKAGTSDSSETQQFTTLDSTYGPAIENPTDAHFVNRPHSCEFGVYCPVNNGSENLIDCGSLKRRDNPGSAFTNNEPKQLDLNLDFVINGLTNLRNEAIMDDLQFTVPAKEQEQIIKLTTLPKFDLEGYIANYSGRTKVDRLIFIAQRCEPLAVEAYVLAIKLLKEGVDVPKYRKAVEQLAALSPQTPEAKLDEEWATATSKKVTAELDRLEGQLKSYKANMIKESIRMGQEDLANFFYQSGDLNAAYRAYARMREFCTQPSHVHEMGIQIIKTCLNPEYANYSAMQAQISRTKNVSRNDSEEPKIFQKLYIASALGDLHAGAYASAATRFLRDVSAANGNVFNEVVSHNDIAVYGGLCALATMDRDNLKTTVIENGSFRAFLDLEPHILRAVNAFVNAKYSTCLQILEDYKTDYLLDIYLSKHVEKLYKMVRHKSIVNYFIPFSTVKFKDMAAAFNTPVNDLIDELEAMIKDKTLNARLDMENESLVQRNTDSRQELYTKAIRGTKEYEKTAGLHLLHMEFISKGYKIDGGRLGGHHEGPRGGHPGREREGARGNHW